MRREFPWFDLMMFVAVCALAAAIFVPFFKSPKSQDKEDEMRKSGCRVIGYAGRYADIKVYRCPGYEDVVSKRDWTGPRTVERQ